jgi:transaldolase
VDKRLEKIGSEEARALRGEAAIANARLAYELFEKSFDSDRWRRLEAAGAHKQRPLWASTGVKDPAYDDTRYVVELVASDIVNTMPEATLEALYDHGKPRGDTITSNYDNAQDVFARLAAVGIDMDDVIAVLEREGVEKFIDSWESLLETMSAALSKA